MKNLGLYLILCLAALAAAWGTARMAPDEQIPEISGLQVYLGEGCIHCHSQYRRPDGADARLWGTPMDPTVEPDSEHPVLFGNRRQGPDLSNVGLRRSRQWNRAHLQYPTEVRGGSRMPDYRHLFREGDTRGEALLDYLQGLGEDNREEWLEFMAAWEPDEDLLQGDAAQGRELFLEYCAGCHGLRGLGDGPLAGMFQPAPRDLTRPSAWIWVTPDLSPSDRRLELARLLKFGRPGNGMAGTEWLGDHELADLIRFVSTLEQKSNDESSAR